jgi:hypothetical protein
MTRVRDKIVCTDGSVSKKLKSRSLFFRTGAVSPEPRSNRNDWMIIPRLQSHKNFEFKSKSLFERQFRLDCEYANANLKKARLMVSKCCEDVEDARQKLRAPASGKASAKLHILSRNSK